MLNLYKYHDTPSTLPLFKELSYKIRLLDNVDIWGTDISGNDLEPLLHIIKKHAKLAFHYAYSIMKSRWGDAEPTIMRDPGWAVTYAKDIIKGRWSDAEPYIMTSPTAAYRYTCYVLKERWRDAEPYIMTNPTTAYKYATNVLKDRWKDAESVIQKDAWAWNEYKKVFGIE